MRTGKRLARTLCIVFLFFLICTASALDIPPLQGPVNDYARLFTPQELEALNSYLYAVDRKSDLQIAVLTIPSLEGENLEDYAIRVAERWEIGQKGKDSGVLLLVAAEDRKLRIEVGYGLEGLITDAQASRIIRSVIAPEFKRQRYGEGVLLGVKTITGLVLQDETLISQSMRQPDRQDSSVPLPALLLFIIIYLLGARFMPGGIVWPLLFILAGSSGRSRGSYSGGSGFSGGGFSGGGGRFGGGGASGSW